MASSVDAHAASGDAGNPPSDGPLVAAVTAPPAKKVGAAWKLPNGSVAVEVAHGPIMDAESWPALPGLASPSPPPPLKASPKASSPSPSAGAVISPVSLNNPGAPNVDPDHAAPVRNPQARRALVMPAGSVPEKHAAGPEPSPVYVPNIRNNAGGGDHQSGRFSSHLHTRGGYGGGNRRANGGLGNGGGGGRRGQEHHGGFDGHRRGGGRRDGHGPGHQQRGPQLSYIRAPPPLAGVAAPPPPPPYAGPSTPHAPPYGPPMGFPDMATALYYFAAPPSEGIQTLPFVPHPASPPTILIPPIEVVQAELLKQIEYYFSSDNLCKDLFLRKHMDEQGWVPLTLIAGFNQVKKMTDNLQFIMDTVVLSTVVEVQGDKIRRRNKWEDWLLPQPSYSTGNSSGSLSPVTSNIDSLASQFQSVGLEGATYHTGMQGMPGEVVLTRSATSGSLGYSLGVHHGNGSGPLFGPKSARSLFRSDTF